MESICSAYHTEKNYLGKTGVCWGTKEKEACSCQGDRTKCDFYPEVREEALNNKQVEKCTKVRCPMQYNKISPDCNEESCPYRTVESQQPYNEAYIQGVIDVLTVVNKCLHGALFRELTNLMAKEEWEG